MLMISTGRDTTFGDESKITDNSFVDSAVATAQRARIIVSAIAAERQRIAETSDIVERNVRSGKICLRLVTTKLHLDSTR